MKKSLFSPGSFSIETIQKFINIIEKNGLACHSEWKKHNGFFGKTCQQQQANSVFIATQKKQIRFLTIINKRGFVDLRKLDQQEKQLVLQALKNSELLKKPSFVSPIIATFIHIAVVLTVLVLSIANINYWREAPAYIALCSTTLVLLTLGYIRLRSHINKHRSISKLGVLLFMLGAIATLPLGAAQGATLATLRMHCFYLYTQDIDD
ncbi:hypothetical protein [Candidatus Uabimicrobium amorphum]|uniref:Uncharacterized protein n=1 Tax=Uabimicrobium amorphum TaxID=2596890 RepID=A0A5S9F4T8_UABAM|nr:hypothetical protein [Candidatus Uabimicrobium amorphum]BBM85621.1 hypothetical protein UABAM_03995 [Candidatus Uabimicrobium amorphum]